MIVGIGYNQGGATICNRAPTSTTCSSSSPTPPSCFGSSATNTTSTLSGSGIAWTCGTKPCARPLRPFKPQDPNHPVSTAHGELPEEALIAELTDIDLWGLNVYRWDVSYTAAHWTLPSAATSPCTSPRSAPTATCRRRALGYEQGSNQVRASRRHPQILLAPLFSDSVPMRGRCGLLLHRRLVESWTSRTSTGCRRGRPCQQRRAVRRRRQRRALGTGGHPPQPEGSLPRGEVPVPIGNNAPRMKDNAFQTRCLRPPATEAGSTKSPRPRWNSWEARIQRTCSPS